jgi:hypothetical protein
MPKKTESSKPITGYDIIRNKRGRNLKVKKVSGIEKNDAGM